MEARRTDRGIQLLRIIACLAVFFCHLGQRLDFGEYSTNLYNFSQLGQYGVELFFVISGYLSCFSLSDDKPITQFYKKRIIRIFPLYYFCILYYFVTETFIFRAIPEDPMKLGWLRYIFCLNGIVPSEGYFWSNIGITWTIPVFVVYYLLAPLIVKHVKSTVSSITILLISIVISFLTEAYAQGWLSTFLYMPCFIMGIVIYYAKKDHLRFYAALGFQLFVFAAELCELNGFPAIVVSHSTLFIVSAIFSTIVLAADEVVIKNSRVIHALDILDKHSFTLYLVHGITFCGIIDKFDDSCFSSVSGAITFRLFVAIIGTFILTIAIHKYVELPGQKYLRKKIFSKEPNHNAEIFT